MSHVLARSALTTIAIAITIEITIAATACSDPETATDRAPDLEAARAELLSYVDDIPAANGHRYAVVDDRGHGMDTAKIIQIAEPDTFAAVYHWWDETTSRFVVSLATSDDLLTWRWEVDLGRQASMPSIEAASDGGYVVAWEQEPDNHLYLAYYRSWGDLAEGSSTKTFEAPQTLSDCAEGTPNLYDASSTEVDIGFHYFADCETDRQARGTTDWTEWVSEPQPLLDRAMLFQGYRGSLGDRDVIEFREHEFTLLEAQFVEGDWRTFRILLYDDALGADDRETFPDAPDEPPSVHAFIHTHHGSYSFTNPTIAQVELDGRPAIVVTLFLPQEGATGDEVGELIYYRFIDEAPER